MGYLEWEGKRVKQSRGCAANDAKRTESSCPNQKRSLLCCSRRLPSEATAMIITPYCALVAVTGLLAAAAALELLPCGSIANKYSIHIAIPTASSRVTEVGEFSCTNQGSCSGVRGMPSHSRPPVAANANRDAADVSCGCQA